MIRIKSTKKNSASTSEPKTLISFAVTISLKRVHCFGGLKSYIGVLFSEELGIDGSGVAVIVGAAVNNSGGFRVGDLSGVAGLDFKLEEPVDARCRLLGDFDDF